MNSFCGDLKPLCNIQPIKRDQKNLRTDEAKMNLCQNDGKKKVKEQLIYHVWSSVKHGRGSVVMSLNGLADGSGRRNSEVYGALIQTNTANLIGQRFTAQLSNHQNMQWKQPQIL